MKINLFLWLLVPLITLFVLINAGEFLVALLIAGFIFAILPRNRKNLPRKFSRKEGRIAKIYPAVNNFLHFFRANYTHKRGVKFAVDHRVMKIYRNNEPRNKKT